MKPKLRNTSVQITSEQWEEANLLTKCQLTLLAFNPGLKKPWYQLLVMFFALGYAWITFWSVVMGDSVAIRVVHSIIFAILLFFGILSYKSQTRKWLKLTTFATEAISAISLLWLLFGFIVRVF